jgi:hypothetical protein
VVKNYVDHYNSHREAKSNPINTERAEFRERKYVVSPVTNKLRDSSVVLITTTVMTVVSLEVFAHFGVPVSEANQIAVIAGFWFVVVVGGVWIWKRLHG